MTAQYSETEIENLLKEIMTFKNKQHFSLDTYFNDIDQTFVVKIHNYGDQLKEVKYFRNGRLVDSLMGAYDFCRNVL